MSNDANALKRKEQIKKWLVYSAMAVACIVFIWFIFKPSKEQVQAEQQNVGLNTQLPDPRGAGIEADKIAAYELEDMRVKQEQKMRTLEDFAAMPPPLRAWPRRWRPRHEAARRRHSP